MLSDLQRDHVEPCRGVVRYELILDVEEGT